MADDPRQVLRSEDMPPYPWSTMGWTQAPDPLRALLADEDRALELMGEAAWNLDRPPSDRWAEVRDSTRRYWLAQRQRTDRAVLAALREVAGL